MAKLKKAKNLSLVENVTGQIENAILEGEYQPGDKLPSTRELQEILGASLGTIRESLAILEQKALLKVRKGAKGGFFVKELTTEPLENNIAMLMRSKMITHRELYEFRMTVEAGLIRLVVQRAVEDDIAMLWQYLDRLKACMGKGRAGWFSLIEIENEMRKEFLRIIDNRTYKYALIPIINNLQSYARNYLPGGDDETELAYRHWNKIIPVIVKRDEDKAAALVKELLHDFMNIMIHRSEVS